MLLILIGILLIILGKNLICWGIAWLATVTATKELNKEFEKGTPFDDLFNE